MNFIEKLEILMSNKDIKNINVLSEQSGIPYMTIKNFYVKGTDNIKLSTLNKLKSFFNCTLDYLVDDDVFEVYGFSSNNNNQHLNEIKPKPTKTALLKEFDKLNPTGQEKAIERVGELTYISKYTLDYVKVEVKEPKIQKEFDHLMVNAAHERTDIKITEEDRQWDDDIMDDENF